MWNRSVGRKGFLELTGLTDDFSRLRLKYDC